MTQVKRGGWRGGTALCGVARPRRGHRRNRVLRHVRGVSLEHADGADRKRERKVPGELAVADRLQSQAEEDGALAAQRHGAEGPDELLVVDVGGDAVALRGL